MNLIKVLLILTVFTIIVLVGICIVLYKNQESLLFHPEKLPVDHDFNFPFPFEELYFETQQDIKINAIYAPAKDSSRGVILYFHGNAGSLDGWGEIAADFRELGYDVLIPDYRGYGKSTGKISEATFFSDSEFIYQHLLGQYDESNIIIYGRSLGSAAACELASKHQPKMLVLESPFLSVLKLAEGMFPKIIPVRRLLKYPLNNAAKITKVKAPIHLIHGTADDVVPYNHGTELAKLIGKPGALFSIEGGAHNDLGNYPEYHRHIQAILK